MRLTHRFTQQLEAPASDVFPLICPVREAEWLPGFEYRMVHSDSGVAEPGCVFVTARPNEPETTWCITTHDPEEIRVEFHRFTPALAVTHIVVQLCDAAGGRSTAEISYTFTSLSSEGEAYIREAFSEPAFLEMVQTWESELNAYLRAR